MPNTILVTGGVGTVGSAVVKELIARRAPVRATTHYPDYMAEARIAPIDLVEVDFERPETLETAFDGVAKVLVIGPESPSSVDMARYDAVAAVAHGVRHVVKLSFLNADSRGSGRLLEWHRHAEELLGGYDVPVTILRPNLFMQNFLTLYRSSIVEGDAFSLPAGNGRVSYVDARDVAACAVEALLGEGHEDKAYDITGPEAVTHEQIAALLSRVTGRTIRYRDEPGSDARLRMERVGAAKEIAEALEEFWASVEAGEFDRVTPVVRQLTGRAPIGFERFADDHKRSFQRRVTLHHA